MFALKTSKGRGVAIAATTALLAAGIVGITSSAAQAAAGSYTAAPALAGATVTTTVVVTGSGFKSLSGANKVLATDGVKLATNCGTSALTITGSDSGAVASTGYQVSSATRLVVPIISPDLNGDGTKKEWKICVYAAASGNALLGSAKFTSYPAPTVAGAFVTPAAGPAIGGQAVTIEGTEFTKASTVKFNGVAATSVVVVDSTTITAVTPAGTNPAGASSTDVVVTNEGGTSLTTGDNKYDYNNTLTVSPNVLAHDDITTVLTIRGTGFADVTKYDWTTAASVGVGAAADANKWKGLTLASAKSTIVFMPGNTNYVSTPTAGVDTIPGNADDVLATQPAGYCLNVIVISDTELTCTKTLLGGANGTNAGGAAGLTYRVFALKDGSISAGAPTPTVITSGSTFTTGTY